MLTDSTTSLSKIELFVHVQKTAMNWHTLLRLPLTFPANEARYLPIMPRLTSGQSGHCDK